MLTSFVCNPVFRTDPDMGKIRGTQILMCECSRFVSERPSSHFFSKKKLSFDATSLRTLGVSGGLLVGPPRSLA